MILGRFYAAQSASQPGDFTLVAVIPLALHPEKFTTWTHDHRTGATLRPGHTALYGLITAKTRQKVVSREADDFVRVDVEFKTSNSRIIDVAGRWKKSERCRTR